MPRDVGRLERVGSAAGRLLAPAVRAGAGLRRSRLLHPVGMVFNADVVRLPTVSALEPAATGLGAYAVLRFSGALWKRREGRPEVLGCAIRFCAPGRETDPGRHDQDLLLATLRSPWTLLVAPFTTRTADFLANTYFGASPFHVPGIGTAKLRVCVDAAPAYRGDSRATRLADAVRRGGVRLRLEVRRTGARTWSPLVELRLRDRLFLDQEALRFDPYRNGRGIRPRGFIHALRLAAYPASRTGSAGRGNPPLSVAAPEPRT